MESIDNEKSNSLNIDLMLEIENFKLFEALKLLHAGKHFGIKGALIDSALNLNEDKLLNIAIDFVRNMMKSRKVTKKIFDNINNSLKKKNIKLVINGLVAEKNDNEIRLNVFKSEVQILQTVKIDIDNLTINKNKDKWSINASLHEVKLSDILNVLIRNSKDEDIKNELRRLELYIDEALPKKCFDKLIQLVLEKFNDKIYYFIENFVKKEIEQSINIKKLDLRIN